jgi:hypothetical protein
MQKISKNCDKELVTVKGQMSWIKHENQNLSNKLNKVEKDAKAWKPTTKVCQVEPTQLEDSQWFESSLSWFGVNDTKLCQNGKVQFGTTWYHNRFGINLSRS